MSLGFSIDNNNERNWFGFGTGDVPTNGATFRAQANEEDDQKKKLAAIDFSATGTGNPAGYTAASAWLQCT